MAFVDEQGYQRCAECELLITDAPTRCDYCLKKKKHPKKHPESAP